MTISEVELKYLVKNIKEIVDDVYYVSNVYPITKNSLIVKFHHSQKNDISLFISTYGICLTKYHYSIIEENDALRKIKSTLERCRLIDISVVSGERILKLLFQSIEGVKYFLIVELFGEGNIIFCNEGLKIISLINPLNVRHRTLKVGLVYSPPPTRGINTFFMDYASFVSLAHNNHQKNIDIKRWLGRNLSISKKFVEFAIDKSVIKKELIRDLSPDELKNLYETLFTLITDISGGVNLEPCIVLDDDAKPIDVYPFIPTNVLSDKVKRFTSYNEAVDEYLNSEIVSSSASQNSDLSKRISSLEHDMRELEKAKDMVILKSTKLREFATFLIRNNIDIGVFFKSEQKPKEKIFDDYDAKILNIKGRNFLEIEDERISIDLNNLNIHAISSSLFNIAKEKERGLISINDSYRKLLEQVDKLQHQKDKKPISKIKILTHKEWYEKYRWFFTSDNLLAIGGRDASSNSVIIRKHLTENDYIFHAEVHGSPFFILKNASTVETDISNSIMETAQTTVSFSRAWKDALSNSDAYWVLPSQIKKGAPSGQYLPKGSFIVEGKRNYIKNLEIKLAIGLSYISDKLMIIVGPYSTMKKRSIYFRALLPTGLDIVKASKKIKSDFIDYSIKNNYSKDIIEYLKSLSIDEIVRILPIGQNKLLPIEKGELEYVIYKTIEK